MLNEARLHRPTVSLLIKNLREKSAALEGIGRVLKLLFEGARQINPLVEDQIHSPETSQDSKHTRPLTETQQIEQKLADIKALVSIMARTAGFASTDASVNHLQSIFSDGVGLTKETLEQLICARKVLENNLLQVKKLKHDFSDEIEVVKLIS